MLASALPAVAGDVGEEEAGTGTGILGGGSFMGDRAACLAVAAVRYALCSCNSVRDIVVVGVRLQLGDVVCEQV